MNNAQFNYMTALQYENQALKQRLAAFESGQKIQDMRDKHNTIVQALNLKNRQLEAELVKAERQAAAQYQNWADVYDDVKAECNKEIEQKNKVIAALNTQLESKDAQIEELKQILTSRTKMVYEFSSKLEEAEGKCQKLQAQLNRDFENSSIPSSMSPNKKKISNSREPNGKRPGGQIGHKGHRRKTYEPTDIRYLEPPAEFADKTRYVQTKEEACRQIVELKVVLEVIEYRTPIFRDKRTGKPVHATFPDNLVNEVNYGGSVKSFCLLLNQDCHVSLDKTQRFLSDLTDGRLHPSKGMLNSLAHLFSQKGQAEEKVRFTQLVAAPVLNTDYTTARVNGKTKQVLICATPAQSLYLPREQKGLHGIKGSPVELNDGTLIHDHDLSFYRYGKRHQECLAHVLRYLKDSMANEAHLSWNKSMHKLLQQGIAYRNRLTKEQVEPDWLKTFLAKYYELIALGKKEYEDEPPNKYYRDGYNLLRRLDKYKQNHVEFLYDLRVSPTNNLAERLARVFKRKQKQVCTFRSDGGLADHCSCLGHLTSLRASGVNLHNAVSSRFNS